MAGTVTNIASRHSMQTLLSLLADEQVQAECYKTPLPDYTWPLVCELEARLPELCLLFDAVKDDGDLTVEYLNDILIAAEEAIATRADYLTSA